MQVITQPTELTKHFGCVLVPTMGALHQGHLSLIEAGKKHDLPILVSIFVNPEQFAPHEDFDAYPRDVERDVELASHAGADIVFAPSIETMYPDKPEKIALPDVATSPQLEDANRPTHFQGVCIVIAKLFDLVRPSVAIFGEKDYQQLQVVRKLVEQLGRWDALEIISSPIIREDDGLAMSSRNVYLSDSQRAHATCLYQAIQCTEEEEMKSIINTAGFELEYAVLRDAVTLLSPIEGQTIRALVAARTGNIRLIDNGVLQS